jgi:zinc transport system permease protein
MGIVFLYFNEIFSMTFDEEFARVSGISTERLNTTLVLLTAVTVVLSMNVVGIMLISALLILPAVTALQLARGFKDAMLISACAALASVVGGIFISLALNLPTGATIVLTNVALFLAAFALRNLRHKRPAS